MTITVMKGICNAEYLAFDSARQELTVNFSNQGNTAQFMTQTVGLFKKVAGPSAAVHEDYHKGIERSYFVALGALKTYDSANQHKHEHFSYGGREQLESALLIICQRLGPQGYPCIPVRPCSKEFIELVNRIEHRWHSEPAIESRQDPEVAVTKIAVVQPGAQVRRAVAGSLGLRSVPRP